MQQIRAFEEERRNWEHERSRWEAREQSLADEKRQMESQLARLSEEMELLRAEAASPHRQGPVEPAAPVRAHHEKQLALMVTIDDLRRDLRDEQARSRTFEQKFSELYKTNRRLNAELDRIKEGGSEGGIPLHQDLDTSMSARSMSARSMSVRKTTGRASTATTFSGPESDELSQTLRSLENSRKEVISLEDETYRLREELNGEKQKVIELKRAGHTRAEAWQEQMQKIQDELAAKNLLEEEVAKCKQQLGILSNREESARREAARLQEELDGLNGGRKSARPEEIEKMSAVLGGQIIAVEQELQTQMKRSSQLGLRLEHFLRHSYDPVAAIRRHCRKIAATGAAGKGSWSKSVPPLFEVDPRDLPGNLMKVLDLLRFAADVLEARDQQQQLLKEQKEAEEPPLHRRESGSRAEDSMWARFSILSSAPAK